ncbi:NAC domain containing protein 83 [Forsythia ovata]|uniref:NAC domain containing protein 83 n=1 Tax=Forsythia ovata TaxID=205694 RepID=A0ABD1XEB1_9LAMI
MEKINFVKNGVLRLPPGFRFHPTDEELLVQYLKRKVLSYPLPASIIPEVDVNKSDPWDLPGDSEQERYFFSTMEVKYPNGNRSNRATGSGYWKATGSDKKIVSSRSHQVVGMKKTLVFYTGKPPNGCRTDWIMHEYRLDQAQTTAPQTRNLAKENWVVCRIFLKRRSNKSDDHIAQLQNGSKGTPIVGKSMPVFYDFMAKEKTDLNLIPVSSSSGSSGITEIESDEHEESSSCNSFKRKPCHQ